jgi:hypothetical protein
VFGCGRREAELHEFNRELLLRFDRTARALAESVRLAREESRRYFERLDVRLADLHAESVAQREGLWRLIDRLGNGGTAPAG